MSHPLQWPFKHFFYPIGNTSAICLTQDLPVEQTADVLLLGCGDPRNILYTAYADFSSQTDDVRRLDFTCCDIEPAILARNILLYTLTCSEESLDNVWNIFYHFYLDDRSYQLLESQCRALAAASKSMKMWQDSKFGTYLKICSTHTLEEMHRHWELYAAFSTIGRARKDRLHTGQKKLSKDVLTKWKTIQSISRSAGMLLPRAVKPMNDLFQRYWRTGTTFDSAQANAGANKLNPTFVYNLHGETFVPHYATFPPQAFHLTSAFAPIFGNGVQISTSAPMDVVKEQFKSWCKAFKRVAGRSDGRLVIRFCIGDVLSFCKALDNMSKNASSRLFTSPFSCQPLELDGDSLPHTFDVIDTSNLMDRIGLLNLLVSVKPLLKPRSTSVLYTETLLPEGEDTTVALLGRMCGDVPTMSLLVGLTPRAFLSGFNSHSNVHELLFSSEAGTKQFHERIAWCDPKAGDSEVCRETLELPITFHSADLGAVLFQVYDQICADEKVFENLRNPTLHKFLAQQHHTRASFAQLIRLAMSRVIPGAGGWEAAIDTLLTLVEGDRTHLVGMNYYQEFCLQLHLHGVTTTRNLSPMWKNYVLDSATFEIFCGWDDVPSVVCVLLSVPQRCLKVFDGTERLGSIPLICHLFTSLGYDNAFACNIHAIPGRVERSHTSASEAIVIRDERGVKDAPTLVMSFLAPAWLLTIPHTKVTFSISSTPLTAGEFMNKLGLHLEIFSAPLTDREHVCVTKTRPGVFANPQTSDVLPRVQCTGASPMNSVTVQVDDPGRGVTTMTSKLDLSALGFSSPIPPSVPIASQQSGACTMEVVVGDQRGYAHYPYPIRGNDHRLRVARKSLYVEVVAPPFNPPRGASQTMPSNMFPILKTVGGLTPWNMHHVNLDIAPVLDVKRKTELAWVAAHTSFQFSEREAAIVQTTWTDKSHSPASESAALIGLKLNIEGLIDTSLGLGDTASRPRIYRFVEKKTRDAFLLIFVHQICLDLPSFTLLADTAVVPLDESTNAAVHEAIASLPKPFVTLTKFAAHAEVAGWKQLLPAVVERCRAWSHGPNCEYAAERIPISVAPGAAPICGCGRGVGLPDRMPDVPDAVWKAVRPFATRAAISPLFAVSYLEPVITAGISERARDAEVRKRTRDMQERATMLLDSGDERPSAAATGGVGEKCAACGGPGKPKLLVCGKCRLAKYCSPTCNRADWKTHKLVCRPPQASSPVRA
ncbi:hypothetical protein DAEQUDRAFT_694144 [Daedalea quercina L-15889]|uniref:MYND-type domain-containing protein n=1 Tax=Daedalea quercina L-15889 TaxID=1314783 RepID=A0A165NWI4_9APHY|nr:hypothetical protein DAEQUDRAFT_694144 [Daedalea quercina L-15889]